MKKIKEYFKENGFELEFKGTYSRKQYRSNYRCSEDYYKIVKDGREFELIVKITGKKLYLMDEKIEGKSKLITGGESQIQFIESLKRDFK